MQKRACCRFPILFPEAARGKLRFQKQYAKTRLILFSHIVSGGCCGNPLVIGAISCFWHQETIWENAPGFVFLYCFWGRTFVDVLVMFGSGYQSIVAVLSEVDTPEGQMVNRFGGRFGGASANSPLLKTIDSGFVRGRPRTSPETATRPAAKTLLTVRTLSRLRS